jgi:translation initiation factor IF-1
MSKKNRRFENEQFEEPKKERDDRVEMQGVVEEALPSTFFKVRVDEGGGSVLCTLGGKLRKNRIRVLMGDRVTIEVSPYDPTRGRITWRK